jgi:hypothetical protein
MVRSTFVQLASCFALAVVIIGCGSVSQAPDAGPDDDRDSGPTYDANQAPDDDARPATPCAANSECDDQLYCNGVETCGADGMCSYGQAPIITDNVGCTVDACDEDNDTVTHVANDSLCDNALYCDGNETCDPTFDCVEGNAPTCGPNDNCTLYSCSEATEDCESMPAVTSINYAYDNPNISGATGLTCEASYDVLTYQDNNCEWTCSCYLTEDGGLRASCGGTSLNGQVFCATFFNAPVYSGCSSYNDLSCCFD